MDAEKTAKQNGRLNPRQIQAVEHPGGPLLILAGAGSGKTRVIVHRIAWLIGAAGVRPWNILALTFTNKAAAEMKERAVALVGEAARQATLSTFHSFCYSVLARDGEHVGLARGFTVYDDSDQVSLIKSIMRDMNLPDNKALTAEKVHDSISYAKNFRSGPAEMMDSRNPLAPYVGEIHEAYEKALLRNNAVDFDNLILKSLDLFEEHPAVLGRYRDRYRHILVDEYQDTNRAQFMLIKTLTGPGQNITVVGDHDQSIYKWRGADISNITSFEKTFSGAAVVSLEQNYRSMQNILDAADNLISHNGGGRGKRLWSDLGEGDPVRVFTASDERDEASFAADEIEHLTASRGFRPSDIAILFRTRAQSRVFEETFGARATPFQVVGITGFYQRREIKDVVAYLKLIANPRDLVALTRVVNVPRRGIGDKTIGKFTSLLRETGHTTESILQSDDLKSAPAKIAEFIKTIGGLRQKANSMALTDFLKEVIAVTGYRDWLGKMDREEGTARRENVDELLSVVIEMEDQQEGPVELDNFLARIGLQSDADSLDPDKPTVKLMTLHCAKGLEFPVVFLVGLEEGLLPHHSSFFNRAELEEERRLCYVGATRAMRRLYLLNSVSRLLFGSTHRNNASRFVEELGEEKMARMAESDLHAGGPGFFDEEKSGRFESRGHESVIKRKEKFTGGALDTPPVKFAPRRAAEPPGSRDFADGDKVLHGLWGEGTVVSIKEDEVCVAFPGKGIKRLAARYAPLKKL